MPPKPGQKIRPGRRIFPGRMARRHDFPDHTVRKRGESSALEAARRLLVRIRGSGFSTQLDALFEFGFTEIHFSELEEGASTLCALHLPPRIFGGLTRNKIDRTAAIERAVENYVKEKESCQHPPSEIAPTAWAPAPPPTKKTTAKPAKGKARSGR